MLHRFIPARWSIPVTCAILLGFALGWAMLAQTGSPQAVRVLARGAGTTMLEGGAGPPDYMPVLTRVAFYVESFPNGAIRGQFECLALAPRASKGETSGDFTTNVMYVTGAIEAALIERDTIRVEGNSECTGIGAGSNVPFAAVIRRGGPGATIALTAGVTRQLFKEILLDGSFEVFDQPQTPPQATLLAPLFFFQRLAGASR